MYMQYMTCTILYTCYMYYYECTTEKLLLYMWPVSHINQHRYTLPVPKSADAAASKKPFPGLQLSSAAALPWTRFPSEHPVLQFGTRQPARVCRLGRFPATRVPSVRGFTPSRVLHLIHHQTSPMYHLCILELLAGW